MADIRMSFLSEILGMYQSVNVILPQSKTWVNESIHPGVLYLLHGATDNYSMWQRYTAVERYAQKYNIAVVMPDGDMSAYTNMKYGYDYFDYVSEELPRIMHRTFPFLGEGRDKTAVAGMSMGGYGALKLASLCPERYGKTAFYSALINPEYMFEHGSDLEGFHVPDYSENDFGSVKDIRGSKNDIRHNLVVALNKKVTLPEFYQVCGRKDFFFEGNREFYNEFENKIPIQFDIVDGGHEWAVWDDALQKTMKWISEEGREGCNC